MPTGTYQPLRDYGVLGDGRTVALVGLDGSVDWLPLPDLDSPTVFGSILDCRRGGSFELCPAGAFETRRRYRPDTNVLEATFETADGAVRVTDAMTLPGSGGELAPFRELQRRVDGLSGTVPMRWRLVPRFGYGLQPTRLGERRSVPVAFAGADAIALRTFDAGRPERQDGAITGTFDARAGSSSLLALVAAHQEPLVLPQRAELDRRFDGTAAFWRDWAADRTYDGPWRDAVIRSALALALVVFAPSGAIAAAATTSLPEAVGGERNWDYRFSWIRDAAFAVDALLTLGCEREANAYFWWLMHASQITHPRLNVLYRLNGSTHAPERTLPLDGYRGSRPVRVGNDAGGQLQLDTYGELLQTAWLHSRAGREIDRDVGRRIARIADFVSRTWHRPDSGIWEMRREPAHFTQSKMMCWVALDRAIDLARRGSIPSKQVGTWRAQADAVREFVERECWSDAKRSYVQRAGGDDLDASVLLGVLHRYGGDSDRLRATVDAVRRELADGPFVRRYATDDGLPGREGAFLACSFWLSEALALTGRQDDAAGLLDELVGLANDVGLYSEEIDPETGAFLGNMPQALSHLALVRAATTIAGSRE